MTKTYVVTTNTELTFMVKAESKKDAVKLAKVICRKSGYTWYKELFFEAYDIEDFMEEDDAFEIEIKM